MPTKPETAPAVAAGRAGPVLELDDLAVHFQLQGGALVPVLGLKGRHGEGRRRRHAEPRAAARCSAWWASPARASPPSAAPCSGWRTPRAGSITYHHAERGDRVVSDMRGAELRKLRTDLQMVFQDPHAALNPSMTIEEAVGDPLVIHGIAKGEDAACAGRRAALERVGPLAGRAVPDQVPLRPVGRPEAAGGDRPGDHPRPRGAGRRRAGLDARHERARQDPPADARPQARPRAHLRLHHPRPGQRQVLLRPDRDHVPRPDRRDRAHRRDLRATRATPTPRRCSRRSPSPTPRRCCRATCRAARSPTPPSRRWAARSTPGARRRWRSAAGSRATCATLIETHWTRPGHGVRRGATVLGDLDHLDTPSVTATVGRGGSEPVRAILDGIRAEDPDEPLWTGVEGLEPEGSGRARALPRRPTHPPCDEPARSTSPASSTPSRRTSEHRPGAGEVVVPPTNGAPDLPHGDPGGTRTTSRSHDHEDPYHPRGTHPLDIGPAARGHSRRRRPAAAVAGSVRTAAAEAQRSGSLKAKTDDGRIEVEAEIDSNHAGQVWDWTLKHNGSLSPRGARTRRAAPAARSRCSAG